MSNELTLHTPQSLSQDIIQEYKELIDTNKFIPYIKFMVSKSAQVERLKDPFPVNHYALVSNDTYIDLGQEVDVLVCGYRNKAIDCSGDSPVFSYDKDSDEYKRIKQNAMSFNSRNFLCGPDFLMWLPDRKIFATYYCYNLTSKKLVLTLNPINLDTGELNPVKCTLCAKEAQLKTGRSIVVNAIPCQIDMVYPDQEEYIRVYNNFINPSNTEKVDDADTRER